MGTSSNGMRFRVRFMSLVDWMESLARELDAGDSGVPEGEAARLAGVLRQTAADLWGERVLGEGVGE